MSTIAVTHQRLIAGPDGITAGDYLTWVRDPEPAALDHGLRRVTFSAEPLGELINIDLVWAGQPPKTPSTAAATAGFSPIPEVAAVYSVACAAGTHRARRGSRTGPGSFSEPFSHRSAVGCPSRTRRQRPQMNPERN
jgi:hypothetical protein